MVDDESSHEAESQTIDDCHQETTVHPQSSHPKPWMQLDYSGVEETDDPDTYARDCDVPASTIPEDNGRTAFNPADVGPRKREYWNWLSQLNRGVESSDRRRQKQEAGVERDLDTFSARLECTERQENRSQWLLDRLAIKEEVIPSGPIEVAVLAVLSLAIDEDRSRYTTGVDYCDSIRDPQMTSVTTDDEFQQLCEEIDVDKGAIRDARTRVRDTDVYNSPNRRR